MSLSFLPALLLAVLPVLLFLAALLYLDSYRLLTTRLVVVSLLIGAASGSGAFFINATLLSAGMMESVAYSRYASPLVEEGLKGVFLIYLIRTNRVGFLVDAGICGFAIGSGFAVFENLYYLFALPSADPLVWILRGCGTAMMHGGCSAILAILARLMWRQVEGWQAFLPGLLAAVGIHSFFNHFLVSPLLSAVVILMSLPPLTLFTFVRSERSLEKWLGTGFDSHARLLQLLDSGELGDSKVGRYLESLREHFSAEIVVDMLCYIRIAAELSMRAKGILLARQRGFEVLPDESIQAKLRELRVLEASIGRSGKLAVKPVLGARAEESWQLMLLEK